MKKVLAILFGVQILMSLATADTLDYKQIPFKTITGDTTNLAAYNGKVILVVNVASKCGFTPQYAGLERLYEKYKDQGFVILGFPANNFFWQEPGSDAEIIQFCHEKYNVTFPMMSKIDVKGKKQHPLYRYLTKESPVPGSISWNFNKFLLDKNGVVVTRYDSKVEPEEKEVVDKIEELLKAK